jgi:hypothetical protein
VPDVSTHSFLLKKTAFDMFLLISLYKLRVLTNLYDSLITSTDSVNPLKMLKIAEEYRVDMCNKQ